MRTVDINPGIERLREAVRSFTSAVYETERNCDDLWFEPPPCSECGAAYVAIIGPHSPACARLLCSEGHETTVMVGSPWWGSEAQS